MTVAIHLAAKAPERLEELAAELRPGDLKECEGFGFSGPLHALTRSVEVSDAAWVATVDDEVLAAWGVRLESTLTGLASVWLLTGTAVDRHRRVFLRLSKAALSWILMGYPKIFAMIDADYTQAIRWAGWLGFLLSDPITWNGRRWYRAEMEASRWA